MNKYTYQDGNHTFKRVNKTTARRAYNNGLRVILCPCNLRPGFPFHPEISVFGKSGATWESALNAFKFYNLRNSETGRYTAFYIPVRMVDRFTGEAPTADTLGTVESYDYSYMGQDKAQ